MGQALLNEVLRVEISAAQLKARSGTGDAHDPRLRMTTLSTCIFSWVSDVARRAPGTARDVAVGARHCCGAALFWGLRLGVSFWLQRQRQRQRFWVHCLLRAIPSVWFLFLLCCGPCAPFMHEWVNEDEMMMVWTLVLESEAVPPRTRLGFVCYEISVMVRRMTDASFGRCCQTWQAHLKRLVLQSQQTRALPVWQQDLGSRNND